MTQPNWEKQIREEWEKIGNPDLAFNYDSIAEARSKFLETNDNKVFNLNVYPESMFELDSEKTADWWLAKLQKSIQQAREEVLKNIRYSWDISEGDEWCVQIWNGNTLIDSITNKSDDAGMVKLSDCISLTPNTEIQ